MRRLVLSATAALAVAAAGCRWAPSAGPDPAAQPPPAPMLAVSAVRAGVLPMHDELKLLGTTVALRHLTLRAPASGRLVDFGLQSGDRVRSGQVVARIVNREIEAAQAGLGVARQLDPAEAARLGRSVRRHGAAAGIPVVVPQRAVVVNRLAGDGQIVNAFEPLADLIDPASVYVRAEVPIDELHLVRPGMEAVVTSRVRPGARFAARVAALSPSFSARGVTSPVRLEFAGPQRIEEAGAAVDVTIITGRAADALVVPVAALFQDAASGGYYVFTVGADGRAHRASVRVGMRSGALVQVLDGLKAGETVITSGGYALSDGLRVWVADDNQNARGRRS
ncbi:MAG: efflux RND transporter periplasmic adaptor subunit [Deltaproteobacteria bacterium]|nr:efflux RND transporter periplasmic adaptor subunit [Deltaproteobacteria bacterium]